MYTLSPSSQSHLLSSLIYSPLTLLLQIVYAHQVHPLVVPQLGGGLGLGLKQILDSTALWG